MNHRPHIDGLRFFLVCGVIFFHLEFEWAFIASYSVPIFFSLSGFLICRQLLQLDVKPPTERLKVFYIRRFLRIVPVHFFVLLVLVIIQGAPFWSWQASYLFNLYMIWMNLFDVEGLAVLFAQWKLSNIHFWSLCVEEQFYLLFPLFLVLITSMKRRILSLLIAIVVCTLVHLLFFLYSNNFMYGVIPVVAANYILWGAFMALIEASKSVDRMKTETILSIVVLISVCLFYLEERPERWMLSTFLPSWYGVFQAPLFGLGILCFWRLPAKHPYARLFSNQGIALLGKVSYGAYLVHLAVVLWMQKFCEGLGITSGLVLAALCIFVSHVLALFMWYSFEARINSLKDRYARIAKV